MTLTQRQPRVEDAAWLAIVRKMPCTICQRPGSDPAHLRTGARQYGKPPTGMGEKPSDCWVLPLCRTHHDDQHRHNELAWWARRGIHDPFAVAIALYATRPVLTRPRREPRPRLVKARKPPELRTKIAGRVNPWPQGRKIVSRAALNRREQ